MGEREDGPATQVLLASVARRFYVAGQSKVQISEELGLSRFQVARLLERARATGMVRIEIGRPGVLDLDASSRLQDAFGLRHAVVVDAHAEDGALLRRQIGAAAADLLTELVTSADVLGVSWARAVSATAAQVRSLPPVPVVQLTGSLSGRGIEDSSVELVRGLSRVSGGPAYFFYAPMTLPDADTAATLRRQPEVARAYAQFSSVTIAVVGIGRWDSGQSTVYDSTAPAERDALRDLGVCAEVAGVFLSADGEQVEPDLSRRMIGMGSELRSVPEVLAVPYGESKAPAVRAAIRSRVVTSLVTHSALAEALLAGA
jgi:DNA-binding transcriptional regulator LsrR (DeoR family)